MARHQYRCPECGGTVPAERVEKKHTLGGLRAGIGRAPTARIAVTLICEQDDRELVRESYTPERREVRRD